MKYLDSVKENVYGHRKKVLFFLARLEQYRKRNELAPPQVEILDLGCGNGTAVTLPIGEQGYSVLGLDMHVASIEYGRRVNTLGNAAFMVSDIENIPTDRRFDVVLLSDILEHVAEPWKLLRSADRVLKRGGIILISIPNGYGPYEVESFLYQIKPLKLAADAGLSIAGGVKRLCFGEKAEIIESVPYNDDSGHIQFFSMRRFKHAIVSRGYEITAFENGPLFCGPVTGPVLSNVPRLVNLNVTLARYVPAALCSAWYFECVRMREVT